MRSSQRGGTTGSMARIPQALLLAALLLLMPLMGCFGGDDSDATGRISVEVEGALSVAGGEPAFIEVKSNQAFTANVSGSADGRSSSAAFLIDENGIMRDSAHTYPVGTTQIGVMAHPVEGRAFNLTLTTADGKATTTIEMVDTIDMLTTDYNNRWCASASIHDGGANYENAANAMKDRMLEMGFDHAEVTDYADDPDQKNVVGYKWGQKYPDEWIVIGGHFDVAYAFTPPGGGTSEGANDDTSGSTVSLSVAEGLAGGSERQFSLHQSYSRRHHRQGLHEFRYGLVELSDYAPARLRTV